MSLLKFASLFKAIEIFAKLIKQADSDNVLNDNANEDPLDVKFLELEEALNKALNASDFFKFGELLAEFSKNEVNDDYINAAEAIRTLKYWNWAITPFNNSYIPLDSWVNFTKGWNAGWKSSEKITNEDIKFTKEILSNIKSQ